MGDPIYVSVYWRFFDIFGFHPSLRITCNVNTYLQNQSVQYTSPYFSQLPQKIMIQHTTMYHYRYHRDNYNHLSITLLLAAYCNGTICHHTSYDTATTTNKHSLLINNNVYFIKYNKLQQPLISLSQCSIWRLHGSYSNGSARSKQWFISNSKCSNIFVSFYLFMI